MNTENPKEQAGRQKCPMHLLSPSAMRETANALGHGAAKYQPRNYRGAGINATTYVGALLRHIVAWNDGEDLDPESGLSHIAHASACCDILLDCMATGMMNDDRSKLTPCSPGGDALAETLARLLPLPPVPEGFSRWEYRGERWWSPRGIMSSYYQAGKWSDPKDRGSYGFDGYHYIEAVK